MLKFKAIVLALILLATSCFGLTTASAASVKVACIGDSITEGFRTSIPSMKSYPAQLQNLLLQTGYAVNNYGIGMRGVLKNGDYPFWNESYYTQSKNWLPDIVIIQLGTNDAKASDWIYKNEFVSNYVEFVNSYKNLSSNPTVYICYPPVSYETTGDYATAESTIVNEMIPMIDEVASQTGAIIIDNHTITMNKRSCYADTLHPNDDGAFGIAYNVYKALGAPGATKATFYKDFNYGGYSAALPAGSYSYYMMLFTGILNDDMSSLKVPSGYTVEVYQDAGFSGTKWTYTADTDNVGSANDKMSSFKIIPEGVTFYSDSNYGGTAVTLPRGTYTMSQMLAAGVANDAVSSIKVPSGYAVDIYQDYNFNGTMWTYSADASTLGAADNQMSSMVIR